MGKSVSLIGQKFGEFIVLERSEERSTDGCVMWLCECSCGNRKSISTNELKRRGNHNCGCSLYKDILGDKFGRLIAVENTGEKTKHGAYLWLCECECGNRTIVTVNALKSGITKSCGCLLKESQKKNIRTATESDREKARERIFVENTNLAVLRRETPIMSNTSGVTGVSFYKRVGKWQAYISVKGKRIPLGMFKDKQDAIDVRKEAEEKYFKPILDKHGKTF